MKYVLWFQSYGADRTFILNITKAHNSIQTVAEGTVLIAAYRLMMLIFIPKVVKFV